MTTTETATVEVLTAEVRVLQVGRRQITMSVYRQLDTVAPHRVAPFGRLNVADPDWTEVEVIGRHRADGTLVTARIDRSRPHARHRQWLTADERDEQEALDECAREWKALPLIVLAGLR